MKNKIFYFSLVAVLFLRCADTSISAEKQVFTYTQVVGEYVADIVLTGGDDATDRQHILIYNTTASLDSLWIEDRDFFQSKVKVKWDGKETFSIENGDDLIFGEVVNITGQVYPAKDSLHVEWRYLQGTGDPNDDYVVTADGSLYNGIKN